MLTSAKARETLRHIKTVIVDEIHALARDKRGSHLTLTLERLTQLTKNMPTRIGLSATQKPINEIGNFLVGTSPQETAKQRKVNIVDIGHSRELDLDLELPQTELAAICSLEQWEEVYNRVVELIHAHQSTIIFVNTRRLAERVAHRLTEILGTEAVTSHHGSLAKEIRLDAEERLKAGKLKAIVATASLELGIDIGYIDLVCQIGSPRSIATFLQRIGRAGHSLHAIPKGRLFPLTRDELLETMALLKAVADKKLDTIEIPEAPLDILAQQMVATVAAEAMSEDQLFALTTSAWPYRNLTRKTFDHILALLSEGMTVSNRKGRYFHRDAIEKHLRPRRGARLAAITSGGAIPDQGEYRVITAEDQTLIGTVEEDFAIESLAGDVFTLGNSSWRIASIRGGNVVVHDALGAPPNIPFWFGEAPGRTAELSAEVSHLREEIGSQITDPVQTIERERVIEQIIQTYNVQRDAATQAFQYIAAEKVAVGFLPSKKQILFERFFDESGGMQLVIHSPYGMRINRAWGLALRKRFCRSFDFELQAAADDNGIVLSLSEQHSFPVESLFKMLTTENGKYLLEQALLAVPMFQIRWRWNITRALAVLRNKTGKKVPVHLQKFQAEDLLAACFPETVGCLENHHGDIEIPDHPFVKQTMHDCLTEAMDIERWLKLLAEIQAGKVKLIAKDTREPSPFCEALLNANPYAFLDDAPLEERRTRAVISRRSLSLEDLQDLGSLDETAIATISKEAWPLVRSCDELHDALISFVAIPLEEIEPWKNFLKELTTTGRALLVRLENHCSFWIATEHWPLVQAVYPGATADQEVICKLPERILRQTWERTAAATELIRGQMQHRGPITAETLGDLLQLQASFVSACLEALEAQGTVLRGKFTPLTKRVENQELVEWSDRRLLARIHRLTLDRLRQQIKPVSPQDYLRFLVRHQRLLPAHRCQGPRAAFEVIQSLQGFEAPAGVWEGEFLQKRITDYQTESLDQHFWTGELTWGRLNSPEGNAEQTSSGSGLHKMVPLSILFREDLTWLLITCTERYQGKLRSGAQQVLEALTQQGALFLPELAAATQLLPAHLDDALKELAALGLITSDSFAAVRKIVEPKKSNHSRRSGIRQKRKSAPTGRWSLFPGKLLPSQETTNQETISLKNAESLEHWCWLLLSRYGVLFRDLLTRESAAPPWYQLVGTLRRLERRGELRGGRFIAEVAGEQYASESVIAKLRDVRKLTEPDPPVVISASDPVNLIGIITPAGRVPALHTNYLLLQDGEVRGTKIAGEIQLTSGLDQQTALTYREALTRGQFRTNQREPEHSAWPFRQHKRTS